MTLAVREIERTSQEETVRKRSQVRPEVILVPLFAVLVIGGWELACRWFRVSDLILPPPSQIIVALYQGLQSGQFVIGLQATLTAILLGYCREQVPA